MKRLVAVLALTLLTSACATRQQEPVVALSVDPDSCGANSLQAAVGQPASILPTNLQSIRIVDVKQAPAAATAPGRVTVVNDIQEQKVREIRCG